MSHDRLPSWQLLICLATGNITVEEFAQVMCVKPGKKPTEAEVQQIIKEVDLDGDGTINFAEFITMMTGTPYAPPSEVTVTSAEKADGSEAAAKDGEELEA